MTAHPPRGCATTSRARPRVTVISAALLLAGCAAPSGPLDRPVPHDARPDLAFVAEMSHTDSSISWSWTLRNDDDAPVVVFVGPDPYEESAGDPDPTWVLAATGSTVEVAQRLLTPPEDLDLAHSVGLAAQVLVPGDELTRTASSGLPLTAALPWGADVDTARAVPDSPQEVYLCVGVGTAASFGDLPTLADEGFDTSALDTLSIDRDAPYATHVEAHVAEQHLFCTDPVPLPD